MPEKGGNLGRSVADMKIYCDIRATKLRRNIPMKRFLAVVISIIAVFATLRGDGNGVDTVRLFSRISGFEALDMVDLADSALKAGDNAKALSLYMAVSGYDGRDDQASVNARIRACLGAGNILAQKANYAGALEYFIKGLKLSESIKGHPLAPTFYKNIGNVYTLVDDYEQGLNYYKLGLEECKTTPDLEQERKLLVNAAVICTYLDRPEESRRYVERSRKVPLPRDAEAEFMERQVEGMLLERAGQFREALALFRELGDYAVRENVEPRFVCSVWSHMYYIFDQLEEPDSVRKYMDRCEREVYANGMINQFPDMLRSISEFYRLHGDSRKAQEYKLRYIDVRDSIGTERDFNAVKNIQFQYEAAKVAGQIDDLHRQKDEREATIKRQAAVIGWVAGGALLLGIFLFVIYRQKRRLEESYRSLYDIHRSAAQAQTTLEERLKEASQVIIAKQREIDRLGKEKPEEAKEEDAEKYSTSNLNDEKMTGLVEKIEEAMDVREVYRDPEFSLDQLAELVGSNTKYVSQTINEAFGKNFSSYVNDYRVRKACRLLVEEGNSRLTVKAIGESAGFKSQSSFTSVFRKSTGLTPSIYQKMAREAGEGGERVADS